MPTYFIGLIFEPEQSIAKEIQNLQKILIENELVNPKKVVKPEKLHLTLKYIGIINDEALKRIKDEISKLKFENFDIQIAPVIRFFGADKREPLLALDVKNSENLQNLIIKIENVTNKYFNDLKKRPFAGHLSIVTRDKKHKKINLENLNKSLEKIINPKNFEFKISKINLVKSENGKYIIL
ncbi:RNA 2',3'-cyclic phosphodiesterase [Candidatus Dependentiae bacterium]|nr:RNA 2',3'-cyclic phosphodiesterase [Candidatus Dependentiae bacterium]